MQVEHISPVPAVIQSPAPVVEYLAPAPAMFPAPEQVVESIAPVPAVSEAPAPGVEYISPAPAVFLPRQWWSLLHPRLQLSFRLRQMEYFAPAPAVVSSPAPVVESVAPAPAAFPADSMVYFSGIGEFFEILEDYRSAIPRSRHHSVGANLLFGPHSSSSGRTIICGRTT